MHQLHAYTYTIEKIFFSPLFLPSLKVFYLSFIFLSFYLSIIFLKPLKMSVISAAVRLTHHRIWPWEYKASEVKMMPKQKPRKKKNPKIEFFSALERFSYMRFQSPLTPDLIWS